MESTHHVHKLLHLSLALRPDLAHFQRDQGTKIIALPTTRTYLRCSGPTRSWECMHTFAESASRICLSISPLFGAGTVLNTLYASRERSRARSTSAGVA